MFGRRRRVAPVIHAPVIQTALPELSDERVFELLHDRLAELIGATGQWTLIPRTADDTDVFFHALKAHEVATLLTTLLATEKAELRGERSVEPTAFPWTPAPISVWVDPHTAPPASVAPTGAQNMALAGEIS
ncbi:hypothetical protein [Glaciibacter psychrotolerans]|uniref:Uncharacterized protein n=1 Tax=Glaciibacter psychrotolerans TaxID=670054 RepID=A0A7Z0EEQ5_9MICO|nr:hypothetical protein [Leifsonia psychrotolerans]NYJ19577.1 hypothetical protein [Leifsonia psychrotolerans]